MNRNTSLSVFISLIKALFIVSAHGSGIQPQGDFPSWMTMDSDSSGFLKDIWIENGSLPEVFIAGGVQLSLTLCHSCKNRNPTRPL
jgi:hypothetical protein